MAVKELVVCLGISPFVAAKQSRSRKLLSMHYQDEREFETPQMLPLSGLTAVVPGLFSDPMYRPSDQCHICRLRAHTEECGSL